MFDPHGMIRTISATRERLPDEIIPVSADQSNTYNDDEGNYSAAHAIDQDFATSSKTASSDGTVWLRLKLDQIYCVKTVIWYSGNSRSIFKWICFKGHCNECEGRFCSEDKYTLTVSSEGAGPDTITPSCVHGDTVKLERNGGWFRVYEIAITGEKIGNT